MGLAPPPVSMLGRNPIVGTDSEAKRALEYKRTLIPVFLTLGLLLPLIAIFSFSADELSMFYGFQGAPAIVLLAFGVALLGCGGFMMLLVKNELERMKNPQPQQLQPMPQGMPQPMPGQYPQGMYPPGAYPPGPPAPPRPPGPPSFPR